jgi:hypothetical protein
MRQFEQVFLPQDGQGEPVLKNRPSCVAQCAHTLFLTGNPSRGAGVGCVAWDAGLTVWLVPLLGKKAVQCKSATLLNMMQEKNTRHADNPSTVYIEYKWEKVGFVCLLDSLSSNSRHAVNLQLEVFASSHAGRGVIRQSAWAGGVFHDGQACCNHSCWLVILPVSRQKNCTKGKDSKMRFVFSFLKNLPGFLFCFFDSETSLKSVLILKTNWEI